MKPRRRLRIPAWASLGAFAFALLALIFWPKTPPPSLAAPEAPPTSAERRTWDSGESRAAKTEMPPKPPAVRLIDDVLVDRTDPCANEPVLVEVKAHDGREHSGPVRIHIGGDVGNPVPVSYPVPGQFRLVVRAIAEDRVSDMRAITISVHDCGGSFEYVHLKHEGTEKIDTQRFVATPFFDRPECADLSAPDGGPASRADLKRCNGRPVAGEELAYTWDFGDGTKQSTQEGYVEHDYSNRAQEALQSTFLVKVEVESSIMGTIRGVANVVFENGSYESKMRSGVITPTIQLTSRKEGRIISWDAIAKNPDPATLTLEDVEITASACKGDETKTFRRPAREVMDTSVLPTGTTKTHVRIAAEDVGASYCAISFKATGIARNDYKVYALFGGQLRDDVGVTQMGPDEADPARRQRYDRTMRALQILGRDPARGPATVSDDEIRALELQGKLD